ncbi:DUF2059 domain-containing protein [Undibacter mobilis]|uniref:DUF2059 domain-containing protein n=1 Tax=Undibacter mobilis TaxID=2292256 RepID=A0A371B304_9BRAD|nr:DUF2059 domain-containing protein [Undibacter mobilis]RDV01966.1 DUF2059 domain-containing protein [Undibacter mobilis]
MNFPASFLRGASSRGLRSAMLAVSLLLSGPALAQQPSPAALKMAGEIVKITGGLELFAPIVPGVVEQSRQFFVQQNPMITNDINEVAAQIRKDYESRVSEVHNKVTEIYAANLSEQELKDILAFYTSPAGKKFLVAQPKIIDESLKFAQEWANSLSDEVIGKMREGLKKKGHKL